MKNNKKIISAHIANDGHNAKLMVAFEGDSAEHCVYVDSYPYVLPYVELDNLEYEEDIEIELMNASLY